MDKIYSIDRAIVDAERGEAGLYDGANQALMVLKAERFQVLEPDGAERLV